MLNPMRRPARIMSSCAAFFLASSKGLLDQPLRTAAPYLHSSLVIYRRFPSKLHHEVPSWVEPGALFHVRIRLDLTCEQSLLTDPPLAYRLLQSARSYERSQRWHITIFLLMPDHLHGILSFVRDERMNAIIGDWKNTIISESIESCGRKGFSTIACVTMNAANSFPLSLITFGTIQSRQVCARNQKTGHGSLIRRVTRWIGRSLGRC